MSISIKVKNLGHVALLFVISTGLLAQSSQPTGYLWGVSSVSTSNIFCRTMPGGAWQQPSDSGILTQVSVGKKGNVWGVNTAIAAPANNVFYRVGITASNPMGTSWQPVNGARVNLAVDPNGNVWAVSSSNNNNVFYTTGPMSANPAQVDWQQPSDGGTLAQISVGAGGAVWGVNNIGSIYYRLGINPESSPMGKSWQGVNGKLVNLAVGPHGEVWGVDPAYRVWYGVAPLVTSLAQVNWVNVPGALLKQLSVDPNGNLWGVNAAGAIFYRAGITPANPMGTAWQPIDGSLAWIAASVSIAASIPALPAVVIPASFQEEVGATENITIGSVNGGLEVWCITMDANNLARLNTDNITTDGNPWVTMPANDATGKPIAQPLTMVSVSQDGIMCLLDANGIAYQYDWIKKIFNKLIAGAAPATGLGCIAVGNVHNIWAVDTVNQKIMKYDAVKGWQLIPKVDGIYIAAGLDDTVMVIDDNGAVYNYDGVSAWEHMPGINLDRIAIGDATNVWGIDAKGTLFQYTNGAWIQNKSTSGALATGFIELAVDDSGDVFLIDNTHAIYENLAAASLLRAGALRQGSQPSHKASAGTAGLKAWSPAHGEERSVSNHEGQAPAQASAIVIGTKASRKNPRKNAVAKKGQKSARAQAKQAGKIDIKKLKSQQGKITANPKKRTIARPKRLKKKVPIAAAAQGAAKVK